MTQDFPDFAPTKPFYPTKLEEERDKSNIIVPLKLNIEEQAILKEARQLLRQPKDSTTIKQLMDIGFKSITSPENKALIETISNNIRKNQRTGFNEIE